MLNLKTAVRGSVEILRDRAGVPHIYGATTTDTYFGLGFAMAQDRLWQMDRLRRRALGRQAEILGPAYVAERPRTPGGRHSGHRRERGRAHRRRHAADPGQLRRRHQPPHRGVLGRRCRSSSGCWSTSRSRSRCATRSPSCAANGGRSTGGCTQLAIGRGGEPATGAAARGIPDARGAREPHPAGRCAVPVELSSRDTTARWARAMYRGSNNWAVAGARTRSRVRRCCAATRTSRSGCRRAGTSIAAARTGG